MLKKRDRQNSKKKSSWNKKKTKPQVNGFFEILCFKLYLAKKKMGEVIA